MPEITLHLAHEAHSLWLKTEDELQAIGLPPPFWAFAWAGGQALARYLLDNPHVVSGRTVLDFATGSGLVAIAAAKAGAARVLACDTDPFCGTAVTLNADLNGVAIDVTDADLVGAKIDTDIVLAGDVFFDCKMAQTIEPWFQSLARTGLDVLVGDPGRAYLPTDRLECLAAYHVAVSRTLEDAEVKHTNVWRWRTP